MTETATAHRRRHNEGLFGALTAGFFFLLIGILFITIPDLLGKTIGLFQDFNAVRVPHTGIYLPAPVTPSQYTTVYTAVFQFSLVWAFFEIAILILRIGIGSRYRRITRSFGNIVFWFGTAFLTNRYLSSMTTLMTLYLQHQRWYAFWGLLVALIGVSLVVRAIALAAYTAARRYQ
ncbi:MAG TPA: hypothetical protein VK487_02675 [Candidatus Bathyarchaeia archaeon]|nr:hypothetical protein [Candidatus Bathyarchaeia archaeon]